MSNKLLYRGQGRYLPPTPYALLIFPFVQLKTLLQVIYEALARMLWTELWHREKQNNEIVNLVAFVVFCSLAWGTYLVQGFAPLIFILSLLIWSLDWGLAIASYGWTQNRIAVRLLQSDEQFLLWQSQSAHFPRTQAPIDLASLKNLTLKRIDILGGAFGHSLGQPWQLSLMLKEESSYFLDQHSDLAIILPKAQQLADKLHIPLIFADSYGDGHYAAHPLQQIAIANHPPSQTVLLQKTRKKWQIKTRWGWRNSKQLLLQILRESGFFLFLIFLANYMVKFGEFIDILIAFFRGKTPEMIGPAMIGDVTSSLKPTFDFGDGLEVVLVIGITIYNGWKFSQVKRVTVDSICVKYFINQTLIYPLPTAQIDAILLLNKIDSELVVIASGKAMSLGSFQQLREGLDFLQSLTEAITNFRHDFGSQAALREQSALEKTNETG